MYLGRARASGRVCWVPLLWRFFHDLGCIGWRVGDITAQCSGVVPRARAMMSGVVRRADVGVGETSRAKARTHVELLAR